VAFVITRLCRDCLDQTCVSECPVDCILAFRGDSNREFPNQLYIDPDTCINCGICEPACPWEAIFEAQDVPDVFKDDIALNARTVERPGDFIVPEVIDKIVPSPEQVRANKHKWGLSD